MSLIQLGMGHGGAVHDRFIVAKHHGGVCHVDAQTSKCDAEVDNLLQHACARGDTFGSKCGGFNGRLQLRMEVNDRLICHVKDSSDRTSTDEIMVEIGIHT